jgi:hypothetical protein
MADAASRRSRACSEVWLDNSLSLHHPIAAHLFPDDLFFIPTLQRPPLVQRNSTTRIPILSDDHSTKGLAPV